MVRIKHRYLLVNIIYPEDASKTRQPDLPSVVLQHQPTIERLTPPVLLRGIKSEVSSLFGDYGTGAFEGSLWVKYLSLATSTFILQCPRAHFQMLWAALTMMNRIPVKDGRPCIFRVVRVSGTIRMAEKEAILQARRFITAAKMETIPGERSSAPASGLHGGALHNVMDDSESDHDGDHMEDNDNS